MSVSCGAYLFPRKSASLSLSIASACGLCSTSTGARPSPSGVVNAGRLTSLSLPACAFCGRFVLATRSALALGKPCAIASSTIPLFFSASRRFFCLHASCSCCPCSSVRWCSRSAKASSICCCFNFAASVSSCCLLFSLATQSASRCFNASVQKLA